MKGEKLSLLQRCIKWREANIKEKQFILILSFLVGIFTAFAALILKFPTFVAVNAVIFGTIEGFIGSAALGITPDLRWAGIWYLWAILWGTSFVEDICGKKLGKFVPCLQVFEGVVTAWIPGVMMLLQIW